ncbi:MAG: PaaI family thioesterase [Bacilli bacterium]|nr:PaaI family thioesterase [Bacilli bacterium]
MKVIKKQSNSKMCLICGLENESGVKAPFYEMEDKTVVTIFEYKEIHQSYPGRVHGGMISCLLDELVGRAIWIEEPHVWGVTMTLNVKFRKPVPYNTKIKGVGRIINSKPRHFEGTGEIYDMDGNLLASAEACYMKLPLSKIASSNHEDVNVYQEDNVTEIE